MGRRLGRSLRAQRVLSKRVKLAGLGRFQTNPFRGHFVSGSGGLGTRLILKLSELGGVTTEGGRALPNRSHVAVDECDGGWRYDHRDDY